MSAVTLNDLIQLISIVSALYFVTAALCDSIEQIGAGRLFSWLIVPTISTLPETITSVILALDGYVIASIYNLIYSAIFDLCIMLTYFYCRKLPRYALYVIFLSPLLFYVLCNVNYLVDGYVGLGMWTGLAALAALLLMTGLPGIEKPVLKLETRDVRTIIANTFLVLFNLVALVSISMDLTTRIEAICAKLGQDIGGLLAAYLTSLPDALYGAVATEKMSVNEGLAEIAACICHDFLEVPAVAAIVMALRGMTLPINVNSIQIMVPTLAVVALAGVVLFVKPKAHVDAKKVFILLIGFVLLSLFAIWKVF